MHPFQLLTLLALSTITLAIPSRRPPASHGRRGLAIEDAYVEFAKLFDSPWITWGYNRRPRAPVLPGAPHGSRAYVPMLADVSMLKDWNASASLALKEGATGLMSFNSPDILPTYLSPVVAADYYYTYMQPFYQLSYLGSPAVTNLAWLTDFLSVCSRRQCGIDFLAVKWSGKAGDIASFQKFVQRVVELGRGKRIWIIELRIEGEDEERARWLKEMLPWMDQNPYVERYGMEVVGVLANKDGKGLTQAGEIYNSTIGI